MTGVKNIFKGFRKAAVRVHEMDIFCRVGGQGDPVLLLHGFPQTHVMWAEIAGFLAQSFTVVCADLRGYGASSKPLGVENYSFREMGKDQIALMQSLGFDSFHLVGHDRGGRVAHRMALDVPANIKSLTLMDIVPTHLLLDQINKEVARAYYHWLFLAQPYPFPETLISSDPDYFYESCLLGWGSANLSDFPIEHLTEYRKSWQNAETVRAMCDDYRAAIDFDFKFDELDLNRSHDVPSLIMWGQDGAMDRAYNMSTVWKGRLANLQAKAMPGGHFFPELSPQKTAEVLNSFFESIS